MEMDDFTPKRPERGGQIVAWLLLLMGLAAFAPCILLPEWRTYQALHLARQLERHRLASLQAALARERTNLHALQSDPAVVARLAKRELSYRDPGEQPIRVPLLTETPGPSPGQAGSGIAGVPSRHERAPRIPAGSWESPQRLTDETDASLEPLRPPAVVARLAQYLPDYAYDAVFCDPGTRPIVITMSVSVMLLGLCLGARQGKARPFSPPGAFPVSV